MQVYAIGAVNQAVNWDLGGVQYAVALVLAIPPDNLALRVVLTPQVPAFVADLNKAVICATGRTLGLYITCQRVASGEHRRKGGRDIGGDERVTRRRQVDLISLIVGRVADHGRIV